MSDSGEEMQELGEELDGMVLGDGEGAKEGAKEGAGKCCICKEVRLTGRFKDEGICATCEKQAIKAAKEAAAKEAAAKGQEQEQEQEQQKQQDKIVAAWDEALGKERDVKAAAWLAERALFYHLPKPPAAMKQAYNKWRRWHDTKMISYVGDKYPNPEHDPYEEGEPAEEEEEEDAEDAEEAGAK